MAVSCPSITKGHTACRLVVPRNVVCDHDLTGGAVANYVNSPPLRIWKRLNRNCCLGIFHSMNFSYSRMQACRSLQCGGKGPCFLRTPPPKVQRSAIGHPPALVLIPSTLAVDHHNCTWSRPASNCQSRSLDDTGFYSGYLGLRYHVAFVSLIESEQVHWATDHVRAALLRVRPT